MKIQNNLTLSSSVQYLPGVGPKKAELLKKYLNIQTLEELLYFFPYKYIDKTRFYTIKEIYQQEAHVLLIGKIIDYQEIKSEKSERLIGRLLDKNYDIIELIWFNNYEWVQKKFPPGSLVVVSGKPTYFYLTMNFVHPEIELYDIFIKNYIPCLEPHYSLPEKLKNNNINSKFFRKIISYIFENLKTIDDPLPSYIIERNNLLPLYDALKLIHFPENLEQLKEAKKRLKFEELFYSQIPVIKAKIERESNNNGIVFLRNKDRIVKIVYQNLGFKLTNAQIRALREIRQDLESGKQMNRLLQGDVGCGKTVVALFALLMAVDNGYQSCLMVPTEILAKQHYNNITNLCKGTNVRIALLTGSTREKEKREILFFLKEGLIDILIGTHALIEEKVEFSNLGLIVIDEQQRFGVAQRAKLWKKSNNNPHVLVMTATPIPRTLAMTLYGDLDLSIIDEMPPGKPKIITQHYPHSKRKQLFDFVKSKIKEGDQVFVVFPLIYESEVLDCIDIKNGIQLYQQYFPPEEYKILTIHGDLPTSEKDEVMLKFLNKEAHILMSTTVIEVGIDIPNATIIIIENAERFGLSQLHQLRGRVGRGKKTSYCFLVTPNNLSPESLKRIEVITSTTNGFVVAQKDLELRGPGDIAGLQQSGFLFNFKIAELSSDENFINLAKNEAIDFLRNYSLTDFPLLYNKIKPYIESFENWGKIG